MKKTRTAPKKVETERTTTPLSVKPMSRPCQSFMAQIGEYDYETSSWFVTDDYPSTVNVFITKDEAQRWLSITMAFKSLLNDHNMICDEIGYAMASDVIVVKGIKRK